MSFSVFKEDSQALAGDAGILSSPAVQTGALAIAITLASSIFLNPHSSSLKPQTKSLVLGRLADVLAVLTPFAYLRSLAARSFIGPVAWLTVGVGFFAAYTRYASRGPSNNPENRGLLQKIGVFTIEFCFFLLSYLTTDGNKESNTHFLAGYSFFVVLLDSFNGNDSAGGKNIGNITGEEGTSTEQVGLVSKITFEYTKGVIDKGQRHDLTSDDLPEVRADTKAREAVSRFERKYYELPASDKYRMMRALVYVSAKDLVIWSALSVSSEVLLYIEPLVLSKFLHSITNNRNSEACSVSSFILAILLGVVPVASVALDNLATHGLVDVRNFVAASLMPSVYRKYFRLHPQSREKYDRSDVTNMVYLETAMVLGLINSFSVWFTAPVGILLSIWQLWSYSGLSMIGAIVLYIAASPIPGKFNDYLEETSSGYMRGRDARNRLTMRLFRNVKSLKLYAWEKPFIQRLVRLREEKELKPLKKYAIGEILNSLATSLINNASSLTVFAMYVWLKKGDLSPEILFPIVMLVGMTQTPFTNLSSAYSNSATALEAQARLNKFMAEKEQDNSNYERNDEVVLNDNTSVQVNNAKISWSGEEAKSILSNVTFEAAKGDLICITGRVASGKTALLKALGGELSVLEGKISVRGSLAYCPQEPWLQNHTLRENILFGQHFDSEWYQQVLSACELVQDIQQFPQRDLTPIGERGVILSGGQQARVCLARAVYSKADVYLLDDVLSAVDEHVSARLIKNIFSSEGLLAHSAIILATNNVRVLSSSSLILTLENNQVAAKETFREVLQNGEKSTVYKLIKEFGHQQDLLQEAEALKDRKSAINNSKQRTPIFASPPNLKFEEVPEKASEKESTTAADDDELQQTKEQVSEQSRQRPLARYYGLLSFQTKLFVGILVIASVVASNVEQLYIGLISDRTSAGKEQKGGDFLLWYTILVIGGSLVSAVSKVAYEVLISFKAQSRIHDTLLSNLLKAPMQFFDQTPIGEVISRFTVELYTLDAELSELLSDTIRAVLQLITNVGVIVIGNPASLLVLVPMAYVVKKYQNASVPASSKIKRLRAAAKPPIISLCEDSFKGQTSIRIFGRESLFIDKMDQQLDSFTKIMAMMSVLGKWLEFRMDLLTTVLRVVIALSAVYYSNSHALSVGYVAVILQLSKRIGKTLQTALRLTANLEANELSLKRIFEYIDLKSEPIDFDDDKQLAGWPDHGNVSIRNLSVKYGEKGPDVLKHISLDIKQGERIGIVGRTGSGKSSLAMSMFRIVEASEGSISIDGTDISQVGLHALRSKLGIIPQDSQIFGGTLRENIDPFGSTEDSKLWEILDSCHLKEYFEKQELGLETELSEDGGNLSRGQCQLICLGRALNRDGKILVLDEATASVDVETDKVIQQSIREKFAGKTVITIAHRLNTIIDSDRILLLDAGEVKEFDTPKNLIESRGLFYGLLNAEAH